MFRRILIALVFTGSLTVSALAGGAAAGAGGSASHHAKAAKPAVAMCGTVAKAPTYKHVIVILMENNSYGSIFKSSSAPYINSVAAACGYASNYHNVTHPSLPNYIAITNGAPVSALGPFLSDCAPSPSCRSSANNIFNETAAKGGWKAYDESMPSACDKTNTTTLYAPKHNPAVYYTDISSASCKADDLALGTTSSSPFLKGLASDATTAAFTFVTPNLCDDMHGTIGCPSNLIKTGDNWLKKWLPLITASKVYAAKDTAVFVVWDEGEPGSTGESCPTNTSDQSCHVLAIWIAPSVKPKTVVSTLFNHYSFLKTTEVILHVPELGQAATAASMAAGFNI